MLQALKNSSLFVKLVIMVSLALCPPMLFSHLAESYFISKYGYEEAEKTVSNVARLSAESSTVIEGMRSDKPEARKQMTDFVEMLTHVSNVKFIVLIDMQGIRLYHPEAWKIGGHIEGGDEGESLHGHAYISSARGSFGFSLRAFRPIYDEQGKQLGAVAVGIMSKDIEANMARLNGPLSWLFALSLAIGIGLAVLLSRTIKKILFGLEPHQIARMLEERNAILRTVREGIIAVNKEGTLVLVNEMAEKILRSAGVTGPLEGQPVQDTVPATRLDAIIKEGKPEYDMEQNINGSIIMTNRAPITLQGKVIGAVATFRDMTEVRVQAERLTGLSNYAEALRSRSHEYLNKMHVISGLLRNKRYGELEEYLEHIIGSKKRETSSIAALVKDPIVAGFLESKYSRAHELGVTLHIEGAGELPQLSSKGSHALVTIVGNLIDNAFDAVTYAGEKRITLHIESDFASAGGNGQLVISVADTGRGIAEEHQEKIFTKGFSTKGSNRGIGLYMLLLTLDEVDGSVEIDSRLGHGSTFTVRFPATTLAEGANP
ncbi:two-component system sensor histidine kinase DcuS [Desulfovibrio desulfuricans]|uniref:histidine kinase n=1 Tax=Desulfovibrio desulfuricans TaxID=876 RepID=A0A4P7ULP6_DESDE|nr:DcuS/MalK family sensor histidine kinase [Desulfovibrio desulfuricans]QCC86767.1 two-component system sensor histidine kinase DcuS [Desulfovibrio desulfuricans]